jgi:ribonuclease Z
MNITFLGTSSALPTKERNVSCIVLTIENGNSFVIDCGEGKKKNKKGTQHQFNKSYLKHSKIQKIFITHLHGDHVKKKIKKSVLDSLGFYVQ